MENKIDTVKISNAPKQTSSPYGVFNVKEMSKPKKQKREDEHLWHNQLKYWLAISLVPAVISLILGYFYQSFLLIAAVFPVVAIAGWLVRKVFRDKDLDKEEWLK